MRSRTQRNPKLPSGSELSYLHWQTGESQGPRLPLSAASSGLVRATRQVARYALGFAALYACGCGNAIYAYQANVATTKLEEARELGAEQRAPYDYTMAVEHLAKAQTEAAEADYSDAIHFAEICEEHATKAIELSRVSPGGAVR